MASAVSPLLPVQIPAADLPEESWDVAIAGAGPAGATVAVHLALSGHRILLLDRHAFPRDKVCGDGLIADTIGALARMGALDTVKSRARLVRQTSVYSAGRHRIDLPGPFLTIKRFDLDAIVAARAVAAGATLARATVTDIQAGCDGVTLTLSGRDAPIRARYAVVATGADLALPRRLELTAAVTPSALAVRCYVQSRADIDRLLISYDREILPGYAWIFPLRNGEYNVGCGAFFRKGVRGDVNLRTMFERFVESFPDARALMRAATSLTQLKGAPLRCGLGPAAGRTPPGVLAIGETIGTTFPFTGEGIGKAMETGELAAAVLHEALAADDPSRLSNFRAQVATTLGPRYAGYRAAQRWLTRAWITDLLARRTQKSRFLQESLAGILNETIDPRAVFSVRGLVRSFLG